MASKTVE
jgi:hypothetical protein